MDVKKIIEKEQLMLEMLDNGDVGDVLRYLRPLLVGNCERLSGAVDDAEYAYDAMLDFMRSGTPDPGRDDAYIHILQVVANVIADWAEIEMKNSDYSNFRKSTDKNQPVKSAVTMYYVSKMSGEASLVEMAARNIFERTLTATFSSDEAGNLKDFLTDEGFSATDRAMVIGALCLGIPHRYEPLKIDMLLDLSENQNIEIRSRAIVGIAIAIICHHRNLLRTGENALKYKRLSSNSAFRRDLITAIMCILRTEQTKSITDKVDSDILPSIINISGSMSDCSPDEFDGMISTNAELRKRVNAISKWQSEGADIQFSSYKMMKHYSFFRDNISNWFRPYDTKTSVVEKAIEENGEGWQRVCNAIADIDQFCDSDKYSLVMTLGLIPSQLVDKVCEQFEGYNENMVADNESDPTAIVRSKINHYIHDLYRAYVVSEYRHAIINPLVMSDKLLRKGRLRSVFAADECEMIGDFCAKAGLYDKALMAYDNIADSQGLMSAEMHKKYGLCFEKTNRHGEAIRHYDAAVGLGDDTMWTMRHLKACYIADGRYADAASLLSKICERNPEDIGLKIQYAQCLMRMHHYERASALLFEVDYKSPSDESASLLARCCLAQGKIQQAADALGRISKKSAEDMIVQGHVQALLNSPSDAMTTYIRAAVEMADIEQFRKMITDDALRIDNLGVDADDISLICEIAHREIKKKENTK